MANQRTILLTGGTGFLGSRILKLIAPKASVILLKSSKAGTEYCGCEVFTLDQLKSKQIDLIIHAAASIKGSKEIHAACNIQLTEDLVTLANTKNCDFLFISSLNVKLKYKGLYDQSKMQAEEIVRSKLKSFIIIRPSYLFSASREPNMEPVLKFGWFFKRVKFFFFPPYKTRIQPLDVDELAEFVVHHSESDRWHERLILEAGGPQMLEVLEVIEQFLNFNKMPCHFYYLPKVFRIFFALPIIRSKSRIFFQDKVTNASEAFIGRVEYYPSSDNKE